MQVVYSDRIYCGMHSIFFNGLKTYTVSKEITPALLKSQVIELWSRFLAQLIQDKQVLKINS